MEGSGAWDVMGMQWCGTGCRRTFVARPKVPNGGRWCASGVGTTFEMEMWSLGAATHLAQERGLPTYNRQERLGRFPHSRR